MFGATLQAALTLLVAARDEAGGHPGAAVPRFCRFAAAFQHRVAKADQRISPWLAAGEGAQRKGDLDRIVACVETSGGIEYTRERALGESLVAIQELEAVPPSTYRDALAALAGVAVQRDR